MRVIRPCCASVVGPCLLLFLTRAKAVLLILVLVCVSYSSYQCALSSVPDSTSRELKLCFCSRSPCRLVRLFRAWCRCSGTLLRPPVARNEKSLWISPEAFSFIGCLAVTYSRMGAPTLPSALTRFTSEFEMGSGGSTLPLPPSKFGSMLEN